MTTLSDDQKSTDRIMINKYSIGRLTEEPKESQRMSGNKMATHTINCRWTGVSGIRHGVHTSIVHIVYSHTKPPIEEDSTATDLIRGIIVKNGEKKNVNRRKCTAIQIWNDQTETITYSSLIPTKRTKTTQKKECKLKTTIITGYYLTSNHRALRANDWGKSLSITFQDGAM